MNPTSNAAWQINPDALISELALFNGSSCLIVDDIFQHPEKIIAIAKRNHHAFYPDPGNNLPGPELCLPENFTQPLRDFFNLHIRKRLGGRRLLECNSRFALLSITPADLLRYVMLNRHTPHIDGKGRITQDQTLIASVLYLFNNPELGGTGFFEKIPEPPPDRRHWKSTIPVNFSSSIGPFELHQSIEPRWNRMIFYDGSIYHSPLIPRPDILINDPLSGRLTLNSFFTCSKTL